MEKNYPSSFLRPPGRNKEGRRRGVLEGLFLSLEKLRLLAPTVEKSDFFCTWL